MKAERIRKNNEPLPDKEIIRREHDIEIRVNFMLIPKNDENDKPESFKYDSFIVKKLSKSSLKQAIIKKNYPTYDDELSAINSKDTKYQIYQDIRSYADSVISIVFDE